MSEKPRRFYFVDNLYAMGIILVLIGHSHSSDWSTFQGTFFVKVIDFIYTFHMPLFFFIAGFLLMNSRTIVKQGYVNWIKDKGVKLLTPYILLSGLAAIPKYYLENRSMAGIGKHLISILVKPRLTVWGHFWFIPVLFLMYAVFGFLKNKGLMDGKKILFFLSATIIFYVIPIKTMWFGLSDIKSNAVFFVIGTAFFAVVDKGKGISRSIRIGGIIVAIAASIVLWKLNLNSNLVNMLIAFLMISVCYQISVLIGDNKIASWISKHNFTIYIYSWPFQAVAMALCSEKPWYITSSIMFVVGFAVPIVMIVIYEKWQFIQNRFFDIVLGIK